MQAVLLTNRSLQRMVSPTAQAYVLGVKPPSQ